MVWISQYGYIDICEKDLVMMDSVDTNLSHSCLAGIGALLHRDWYLVSGKHEKTIT